MVERGHPGYHARQVFRWVFAGRAERFEAMSDLPKRLREQLDEEWAIFGAEVVHHHVAPDGTDKLLLDCADGRRDRVRLDGRGGSADGLHQHAGRLRDGVRLLRERVEGGRAEPDAGRDRRAGDPAPQPPARRGAADEPGGHGDGREPGEPRQPGRRRSIGSARPEGLGLGQRRVTISTVGLPEKMREAGGAGPAVSPGGLAARPDRSRCGTSWCRSTRRSGLNAVIAAADAYFRRSGRQVTFEYVLLRGINDRAEDAEALADLLRGAEGPRQLDPVQPRGRPALRAADAVGGPAVRGDVRSRGVSVSVRKTKGREIDAACGQLRRRFEDDARSEAGGPCPRSRRRSADSSGDAIDRRAPW